MKYCFTYLYAVCRALLQKNLQIYLVTENEKDTRPTIYFKNGSYIKTIAQNNKEDNCRGRRAAIIDDWYDCNTPSKEEIDEVLKGFKG